MAHFRWTEYENHFFPTIEKGKAMTIRIILGSILMMCILALPANAGGKEQLQKYYATTAIKVKATDNALEKRKILGESFQSMSKVLNMVQNSPLISKTDRAGIDRFKAALQEKQDELAGSNGYVRVPDENLNGFSDYVVQDMEQAAPVITISLVALVLIVILIVLVLR
jgi:hypothetical protein